MTESEFGQQESLDASCLAATIQVGGGAVMTWGMFSVGHLRPTSAVWISQHGYGSCVWLRVASK